MPLFKRGLTGDTCTFHNQVLLIGQRSWVRSRSDSLWGGISAAVILSRSCYRCRKQRIHDGGCRTKHPQSLSPIIVLVCLVTWSQRILIDMLGLFLPDSHTSSPLRFFSPTKKPSCLAVNMMYLFQAFHEETPCIVLTTQLATINATSQFVSES